MISLFAIVTAIFAPFIFYVKQILPFFAFIKGCFFQQISGNTQKDRLESFYASQAQFYDQTRTRLLAGREDMLRTAAAALIKAIQAQSLDLKNLVWVDIGGGTGWNIEKMHKYIPIDKFKKVYLIDLCPSLCQRATDRFQKLGWDNVQVVCADACSNPDFFQGQVPASLVTFSYSLSMIPNFFAAVDFAKSILHEKGIIGVVDFGVSDKTDPYHRHYSWIMRWFWQIWFEFDHIALHSSRRKYVEHCFEGLKDFTGRNKQMLGFPMPYYIYLGCKDANVVKEYSNDWRLSFNESEKTMWDTYMYAFAWEDPKEDFKVMDLKKDDKVLAITSGGCNILDFVLNEVDDVWSVDMNPAQNNLLELKLAAYRSGISYEQFWKLFGLGRYANFRELLDFELSPHLSAGAYRFWKKNVDTFEKIGLYNTGHSGSAVRFARTVFQVFGVSKQVKAFCNAKTTEESWKLWDSVLRPTLFSKWLVELFFNQKKFMWNALGVPQRQMDMLLKEYDGNLYKCILDTLDPIGKTGITLNDNYFYYCTLMSEYSPNCCPEYLKPEHFENIRKSANINNVRIHTQKIVDVLRAGGPRGKKFTKVVIMDHMDWFTTALAEEEISALWDAVEEGGKVYWRSAESKPWYNQLFEKKGFSVQQIAVRKPGDIIDRVNMYLSFNVATKTSLSTSAEA